ncbi:MAG: IS200/IS605 family transposase [Bacteroidetes bacterium]|nr:IS200/IS605 family transposase [Bacteroidota bacterium]
MSHSYTKLLIHLILVTKDREILIGAEIRDPLYSHLKNEFKLCKSTVIAINGTSNHVHLLIQIPPQIALTDLVKQVKGETSHWINSQNLMTGKFTWQPGYSAFSVGRKNADVVKEYIYNQTEHHKKTSFQEEYQLFLKVHGLIK